MSYIAAGSNEFITTRRSTWPIANGLILPGRRLRGRTVEAPKTRTVLGGKLPEARNRTMSEGRRACHSSLGHNGAGTKNVQEA